MTTLVSLDLDAARRELTYPDGFPVIFGGTEFTMPAELPVDVLDPFLDPSFDLAGLLKAALESDEDNLGKAIVDILTDRPTLPLETLNVIYAAFEVLFGEEQWPLWKSKRPGFGDYARLLRGLWSMYGTTLGEAFASVASSGNGGLTRSTTSSGSTESTPAPSGDDQDSAPDTSESAA